MAMEQLSGQLPQALSAIRTTTHTTPPAPITPPYNHNHYWHYQTSRMSPHKPTTTTQSSPLLRLPPELRNDIFERVISASFPPLDSVDPKTIDYRYCISIPATCRQTHSEVQAMLIHCLRMRERECWLAYAALFKANNQTRHASTREHRLAIRKEQVALKRYNTVKHVKWRVDSGRELLGVLSAGRL
jgi:hypothetical protein